MRSRKFFWAGANLQSGGELVDAPIDFLKLLYELPNAFGKVVAGGILAFGAKIQNIIQYVVSVFFCRYYGRLPRNTHFNRPLEKLKGYGLNRGLFTLRHTGDFL